MQLPIITESVNAPQPQWQLYLLRTRSGNLYTGISTDPLRRLRQHQGEIKGGARALRGKGPLALVWTCHAGDRSQASVLEYQLKQLNKTDKERLVLGLWQPDWLPTPTLTQLATQLATATEVA